MLDHGRNPMEGDFDMSIVTRAALAAALVLVATAAHSRDLDSAYHGNTPVATTYLNGPKSGLTQTIRGSYAQSAPVRQRAYASAPRSRTARLSGGVNAIGADEAN
jgi:hypothetical protein